MVEVMPIGVKPLDRIGKISVVNVSRSTAGTWIVEDEKASRGGLFLTWEAALRFIRREFGHEARIVTQMPSMREAA